LSRKAGEAAARKNSYNRPAENGRVDVEPFCRSDQSMSTPQLLAFLVILGMMVAFIWGRWRYDLVAAGALLVAVALGIVAPEDAFSGFSDDIVIIVGSALVVSAAVARSGMMEVAIRRFAPGISAPRTQLILLVLVVTVLSAFIKNIGALAIMIPIAFQMARTSGV